MARTIHDLHDWIHATSLQRVIIGKATLRPFGRRWQHSIMLNEICTHLRSLKGLTIEPRHVHLPPTLGEPRMPPLTWMTPM